MQRRTDPFKVLILIVLLIIVGLQMFNLTGLADAQHSIHNVSMETSDIHTHLEAINPDAKPISLEQVGNCDCGEYQIDLELDGVLIYDGDRFVAFIPNEQLNTRSALDSIFMKDNQ